MDLVLSINRLNKAHIMNFLTNHCLEAKHKMVHTLQKPLDEFVEFLKSANIKFLPAPFKTHSTYSMSSNTAYICFGDYNSYMWFCELVSVHSKIHQSTRELLRGSHQMLWSRNGESLMKFVCAFPIQDIPIVKKEIEEILGDQKYSHD